MRKVAFLAGNDTFPKDPSIPPLRFTQNDARELAEILEDPETCGFETRLYLNRPSQEVLSDLDQISGELGQDDTLLFYYSGHGKLRGNELCLVSNETTTTRLGATSIRARLVLTYLQESLARRRILILDCCHSGAIGSIYRAVDSKSALDGLADSFGSYILTASTTIELAEEREKDGHGVFTKALIDCLRDGVKESITVNDWYEYAYRRLRVVANQTPLKWGLQEEGPSFEIANFKARHERERQRKREQLEQERQLERERLERERQLERERLIATARTRLGAYVALGELTGEQAEEAVALLKRDEARLFPRDRRYRDDLVRFSKGEASFLEVFGAGQSLRPESAPRPPENEVSPPLTPPEAAVVDQPLTLSEPPAIGQPVTLSAPEAAIADQFVTASELAVAVEPVLLSEPPVVLNPPVTPSAPKVLPGTDGGGALPEAKKSISAPPEKIALFIPTLVVIGVVILAVYFFFAQGNKSVPLADHEKRASLAVTNPVEHKSGTPSLVVEAVGMGFASLNNDTRFVFSLYSVSGVVVTMVDPGSAAAEKHIRPGNVLSAINNENVNDPTDVAKIMKALKRDGKQSADFAITIVSIVDSTRHVTLPLLW